MVKNEMVFLELPYITSLLFERFLKIQKFLGLLTLMNKVVFPNSQFNSSPTRVKNNLSWRKVKKG